MRWYVVLATMLLAATMPSAAAKDDRLRIGIKGDIARLDPHILNETLTLGVLSNVMEGLVRRDVDLKVRPGLATRWETLSPLHWRFHLRRVVRFHDGAPFTAGDVLFTFERARGAVADAQQDPRRGALHRGRRTYRRRPSRKTKPDPARQLGEPADHVAALGRAAWARRSGSGSTTSTPHSGERHRALSRHLASRGPSHPLRAPSPVVGRGTRPREAA